MVERGGLEAYEREMWAAERRSKREANVLNANRGALKKRISFFLRRIKVELTRRLKIWSAWVYIPDETWM